MSILGGQGKNLPPMLRKAFSPHPKMERVDKLQALVDLTSDLYQHYFLHIAPTWFCGVEADIGYSPEGYDIGWQNDFYFAGIDLTNDSEAKGYLFWFYIIDTVKKDYLLNEKIAIVDIIGHKADPLANIPKFKDFIDFVNKNFSKEGN